MASYSMIVEGETRDVLGRRVRVCLKELVEAPLLQAFYIVFTKLAIWVLVWQLKRIKQELIPTSQGDNAVLVVKLSFPHDIWQHRVLLKLQWVLNRIRSGCCLVLL